LGNAVAKERGRVEDFSLKKDIIPCQSEVKGRTTGVPAIVGCDTSEEGGTCKMEAMRESNTWLKAGRGGRHAGRVLERLGDKRSLRSQRDERAQGKGGLKGRFRRLCSAGEKSTAPWTGRAPLEAARKVQSSKGRSGWGTDEKLEMTGGRNRLG